MKKGSIIFISLLASIVSWSQSDFTYLVNPFIGTGGHGHTYPGASAPFGMVQLSPDTRMADWDGSSGYHYSDSVIYGFSHTHLSGTGIPDYCDVLLMPFTGPVHWKADEYRSHFSHRTEKASPGYYEVMLDRQKIRAQLSATPRTGFHQYSFPLNNRDGRILIDLMHRDAVLDAHLEKISDHEIRGYRRSRSWASDQAVYFVIRFENPITAFELEGQEGSGAASKTGKSIRAYVKTALSGSGQLRCQVGLSGVSMDGARANLDAESRGWDLEETLAETKRSWNRELGKVELVGGTRDQQTVFYTALYHTFLVPNLFQDADGQYRGTDGKNHKADGFTNYTVFSLWDTYRAYHPLMTILQPRRTTDWIQTFLHQYQNGGMLPVWELAGNETFCMIGYHSVPVIWDAWQKGIRNFDAAAALKAARAYAESDRFGLDQYRAQGYISNDHEHESVSKTLEYAYDDWCIAQLAKALGEDSVAAAYFIRAQSYKNLFDPETHHMRGKIGAMWQKPFDPREINNYFTEGNSWQYSFAVPQDIAGLIRLHGGRDAFAAKLDELFTTSAQTTGREQADVTGLIGQYAQGNEPSHHMAYLFAHVGQSWRTEELVHRICTDFYTNAPDGLIGNEDCGQMSAWYIMSALGFYPVTPGSGEYVLGTPLFDEVTLHLDGDSKFVIRKRGTTGPYVSSVLLNKKPDHTAFLSHADIARGGELTFIMTDKPSKERKLELPHSSIAGIQVKPAPYFDVMTNKFRDSLTVTLRSADPSATIYYYPATGENRKPWTYTKPFTIHQTTRIMLVQAALRQGDQDVSFGTEIAQDFFKLPTDRTIGVSSKVHPLYTGGGNEMLIDGLQGTANWRSGDWQSYFDTDFDAVVDLQAVRPVSFLGIHVLQDVSPWILYPKEVVFYASDDGKNYREVSRVANRIEPEMKEAETQVLGRPVQLKARYIRIRAVNGGHLPAWHESAGNPSHLFIDEVIVR